jgi:DNA-binding transcriptional MerR regulator
MLYTIGEMANKMNVTPSTLRYYDKEGLLPFVERSKGGIRIFKDEDFEWLSIIECLKKTDMPIKDIKTFIDWCMEGDNTIGLRKDLIEQQRNNVTKKIEQLNETLEMLNYKFWYYEKAEEAGSCSIHQTIKEEDIPEEFRTSRNVSKGILTQKTVGYYKDSQLREQ